VGELAQRQFTAEARARVEDLLRGEPVPTLAGVAMWADRLRASDPERFKATSTWHYVNIHDKACRYEARRDCRDGACVLGAIESQKRLLQDATQPVDVRREALKFIVHFVADVHQPLHSSYRPDRGANAFQISLRTDIPPEEYARDRYKDGMMGTNLHAVWDYYVLASASLSLDAYANRLAAEMRSSIRPTSPEHWAEQSCELIDRRALYPRTHEMDSRYLNAMRPLAERRVVLAANRLAALLNDSFGVRPDVQP
jgi:hypothetical protein